MQYNMMMYKTYYYCYIVICLYDLKTESIMMVNIKPHHVHRKYNNLSLLYLLIAITHAHHDIHNYYFLIRRIYKGLKIGSYYIIT